MPLVEVDESELLAHRRLTEQFNQLLANPKTRTAVLKAQKELHPELVIPELDAAEPVRGEISELREEVRAFMKAQQEAAEERAKQEAMRSLEGKWKKGQKALRANGYTDEGIAAIEKLMEEKGLADHEIAAAYWDKMNPPQQPVRGAGGNQFDLFRQETRSEENMKALFEDPNNPMALDALVNSALEDVRGR